MRSTPAIAMLLGVLILLSGLTFTLQGLGLVGPQGSIMFENQSWVIQGAGVLVLGLIIMVAGAWLWRRNSRAVKTAPGPSP